MRVELCGGERESIVEFLRKKREESGDVFSVVDVGGSATGWSRGVIDALVDKFEPGDVPEGVEFFGADFIDEMTFVPLLDYVAKNGKFTFSICCHVIEDLESFLPTLRLLEKISKSGVVIVPSKHMELMRFAGPRLGYIHHRWVFDAEDDARLVAYPKIGALEYLDMSRVASDDSDKFEWRGWWDGKIDVRRANDGFLGPTEEAVIDMYEKRLLELP
jgi:hypothetical protein